VTIGLEDGLAGAEADVVGQEVVGGAEDDDDDEEELLQAAVRPRQAMPSTAASRRADVRLISIPRR